MKYWIYVVALFLWTPFISYQAKAQVKDEATLKAAIDQIREKTRTPGIAVTIIKEGEPDWLYASGLRNIQDKTSIDSATQFRFASISKMFISLGMLTLVEQGKVSLDDKVKDLLPHFQFSNPWQATHPLRVKHLLNHSTGWDGMHFAEQISASNRPISIEQALAIHPDSRESRWPPGTRVAYNNTAPLVAAFIIEKLTNTSYEDFIKTHFFEPLSMSSSDYFYSDTYHQNSATLYKGVMPISYVHLNNRAAGGLNSSMSDMAAFLTMLIGDGKINGKQVLSPWVLEQFAIPMGTDATDAGLELTYGLGNTRLRVGEQVFIAHEGSLVGTNSLLAYSPSLNVGYLVVSNSNSSAVSQVHQLLSAYLTQGVPSVKPSTHLANGQPSATLSGMYQNISPISELVGPFISLMPWRLSISAKKVLFKPLFGPPRSLSAKDAQSMLEPKSGKVAMVVLDDPISGQVVQYGTSTFEKVPSILVYVPFIVILLWVFTTLVSVINLPIWLTRKKLGKVYATESIKLRLWALLPLIFMVVMLVSLLMIKSSVTPEVLAGQLSLSSGLMFIASIFWAASTLWSVKVAYQGIKTSSLSISHIVAYVLISMNLIIVLWGLVNGYVGLMLWR